MEVLLWVSLGMAGGFALASVVFFLRRRTSASGVAESAAAKEYGEALVESSPDGFVVVDEDLKIVHVNDAYCRMAGRPKDEFIGRRPPLPGWAPEEQEKIRVLIEAVRRGDMRPVELSYVRSDGSRIPVMFRPGSFRTRKGKTHYFAIAKDLAQEKMREEELKEREATFRRIAETSSDTIYQIDLEGTIVYCSPGVERILGYTAEEFTGTSFRDHFLPKDLPAAEDAFVRSVRGEEIRNIELRILDNSKNPVSIELSATPIWKDDRIVGSQGAARDITERKRAEESLRASEARLRTVIESIPFDFFFIGEDGRYAMQNTTITETWGGSLVGKRPEDLGADKETLSLWLENNRRAFAGEVVEGEVSFKVKGKERHYYNIISPVREGGRIRGILGVNVDITERKLMETALRESEEKYRFLVENTGTAVTFWDPEGRLILVNRIAARYFDRTPEELIGRSFRDVLPERMAEDAFEMVNKVLGSREGIQQENEIELSGGKRFFRSFVQPVGDAEGKPLGVQIVSHDITELMQAERSLRERDARLRLMVSQLPAILWTVDRELRFTSSAGAGLRALGLAPGRVVGMTLFEYFNSNDPEFLPIAMHRKSLRGKAMTYEMTWDGRVWETHTEPLRDESGEIIGCLAFGLDITRRKQAEDELKRSRERLRALAGRLQEVREEESANIAREIHDELGQALTGLKLDLSFIQRRLSFFEEPAERSELESKIEEMNREIDSTINAVRRISTQLRPKILDELDLVGAIEWQAQEFQQRTNIVCDVNAYGMVSEMELDQPRSTAVFRIFQEILANVRRHADATHVWADLRREDDAFLLEVRDDGKGIPKDKLPRLEGLGILGMRERAQVFGGHVVIDSEPGKGTSVQVKIPLDV